MPLSDYINIRPAPEATGGYNSGLGVTAEEMAAANRAFDFQTAANTWPAQTAAQSINLPGVDLSNQQAIAALLANTNIVAPGQQNLLPANIFQGPVSNLGVGGLGINALVNLLSAAGNLGQTRVGLDQTAGNVSMTPGLGSLTSGMGLSGMDVSTTQPVQTYSWSGEGSDVFPLGAIQTGSVTPSGQVVFDSTSAAAMAADAAAEARRNAAIQAVIDAAQARIEQNAAAQNAGQAVAPINTQTEGVVTLPSFGVNESMLPGNLTGLGGQTSLNANVGAAGDNLGVPGAGNPYILPSFTASESLINTGLVPADSSIGQQTVGQNMRGFEMPSGVGGVIGMPPFSVNENPFSGQTITNREPPLPPGTTSSTETLPPYVVTDTRVSPPTLNPVTPPREPPMPPPEAVRPVVPPIVIPQPPPPNPPATPPVVVPPNNNLPDFNVPDLGTLVPTAITPGTGGGRNFAAELAASRAALQGEQGNLMNMYGGIYQNLLGQTAIPEAAQSSLNQMRADQAKLQRIQQGQLAAEDIRQAQQAAREAYGARGQVMGQPAIGAEILNREAIRQQREDQARAGYQASMGNVFNAANLQTGNIFSPIGSLVGQTFNPLGAYPQDVYSSNFNAAQAQQIAAMNNAAAIEAAKYGAQAQRQAATTSGLFNLGARLIPGLFG